MVDKSLKMVIKAFLKEKKQFRKEIMHPRKNKNYELGAVERAVVLELIELDMQLYNDWMHEREDVQGGVPWIRESCINIKLSEYIGKEQFYIVHNWSDVKFGDPEEFKKIETEYRTYLDTFCDEKMKYYAEQSKEQLK
ncbi:MAG: hypothetical protein IJ397_05650 [Lachnospiraceae bacterium]|nr:hypothetical protein [Lachnospiraceae bacterium]